VLLGSLPTGGYDTITANPASEADLDEEALDHAAMDSGTD
jgi:argininosuccinate synthase